MIFYDGGDFYGQNNYRTTYDGRSFKNIEECLNKQIAFRRKVTVAVLLAGTYVIYKKIRSKQNND